MRNPHTPAAPAVRAFLAEIGAKGGATLSKRKAKASIANGKKGGRPRGPNYRPRKRPKK